MAGALVLEYQAHGLFHQGRLIRVGWGSQSQMVQTVSYPDKSNNDQSVMLDHKLLTKVTNRAAVGSHCTARQRARAMAVKIQDELGSVYTVHGPYELPAEPRKEFRGGDTLQEAKSRLGLDRELG